ncbi:MAG: hypothetical protein QOD51_1423 [Candidatus Eremiobacteraeota bacterium]|jgi:hypothetical protein|nr:hypothetical protein [Candidatus Eremiobacteraeota bacterium]
MFRRSSAARSLGTVAVVLATGLPAGANPVAGVRVANGSAAFELAYAASASALGGYVTSDNAPLATIPRQTTDAFTIASTSAKALAGELIYRAAGEPARECTFRYTLAFAGGRYVLTTDARASWTGQVTCTAAPSVPDKAKGDFSVTFTMK